MNRPIDTTTGLQCGPDVFDGSVLVVKGWLVTLPDGFECRLGPDETRAQNYAVQQRATSIEPMYVRRVRG